MKKDSLEKFILDKKEEFNQEEPRPGVWEQINAGLEQEFRDTKVVKLQWYSQAWKAAAVFLLMVSAFLLWDRYNLSDEISAGEPGKTAIDFQEVEVYYTSMIDQKKELVETFKISESGVKESFIADLKHLDSMYDDLGKELKETGNQKVVDAMINNLKLRIQILDRQLTILEQMKKTKDDESVNI